MDAKGSLPHVEAPATCLNPEPEQSSPCIPSHVLKIHFNIIVLFTPGFLQVGWTLNLERN